MDKIERKECLRPDCDNHFISKVHNQIFCSNECMKIETNRRIMRQYYKDKARLKGETRWCSQCSETKLSRYNEGDICSLCERANRNSVSTRLLNMIGNVIQ